MYIPKTCTLFRFTYPYVSLKMASPDTDHIAINNDT